MLLLAVVSYAVAEETEGGTQLPWEADE